jgi:hypothetical protein
MHKQNQFGKVTDSSGFPLANNYFSKELNPQRSKILITILKLKEENQSIHL